MRKSLLAISADMTRLTADILEALPDWEVESAKNLAEASRRLRHGGPTVGLFDYEHHVDQPAAIDVFLRQHSDTQWVGIFNPIDLDYAPCRDLIIEHFCDYHTKPVDTLRLAHALGHAHGWTMLKRQRLRPAGGSGDETPLVGHCEAMQRLRAEIRRVAKVSAPVLIWGESGCGKELTAQAIHAQSERAGGPFVPINCGAISPTLIHSELFGYERGAFTGAARVKAGLIESADGGTLFLDEIGDLPKDLQANLLRFLQESSIYRLGSTRQMRVDVRVIAASNMQLQLAVADGRFREDLYYRLAVLPVTVPALRERRDDLVALAEHFFHAYASDKAARLEGFSSRALAAILEHDWPGNVRELINRVRRALVMADGRLITPEDLGLEHGIAIAPSAGLDEARIRSERSALRACLDRSRQNVSRAARELGVSRTTMYRLLDKHGMRASET